MYDIYTREKGQHRVGHLSFRIGGVESEMTIDPSQYMMKFLPIALDEGLSAVDAPVRALDLCIAHTKKVMARKVGKLKRGQQPGGIALGSTSLFSGGGIDGVTAKEFADLDKGEGNAIEKFLARGRLYDHEKKRPLTRAEREEVHAYRAKQRAFDNEADWQQRRKALYEKHSKMLSDAEAKLSSLSRQSGEVPAEFEGRQEKLRRDIRGLRSYLAGLKGPFAASHGFQYAYTQYWTAAIQLATDDIRIWPLMTNTTLDTVRDAVDTFSDVTADEFDGSNYSSGGLALDSQAVAVDDANDRAEFDAADEAVTALGAGTRSIQGVAVGKFVTNTAASIPLHWIEFASNKTPDGSDFTFVFNAEGILQAADG